MTHRIALSRPNPQTRSEVRGREHPMTPRLALRRSEAAAALGVSDEHFDRYVRPELPVVRLGGVRIYPVSAIEAWLTERASAPTDDVGITG